MKDPDLPRSEEPTDASAHPSGEPFDAAALALAERSAGIGVWSIDLATGLVRATAQFFRIMGLEPTREPVAWGPERSPFGPSEEPSLPANATGWNTRASTGKLAPKLASN